MVPYRLRALCIAAVLIAFSIVIITGIAAKQEFITSIYRSSATGLKPDTLDYGIGIIAFANPPGYGPPGRKDTIVAYEEPQQSSKVLGLFLYSEKKQSCTYAVAGRSKMQANVLEFDYEECGVPFDTILADNQWVRAVLGFRETGEAIAGWVRLDSAIVRYLRWVDELPSRDLFFLQGIVPEFHDRQNGSILEWEVSLKPPLNYIMHPVDVRPPWMQVRVARPADICVGQKEVHSDTLNAWIRFIRKNGRPAVWYYAGGC